MKTLFDVGRKMHEIFKKMQSKAYTHCRDSAWSYFQSQSGMKLVWYLPMHLVNGNFSIFVKRNHFNMKSVDHLVQFVVSGFCVSRFAFSIQNKNARIINIDLCYQWLNDKRGSSIVSFINIIQTVVLFIRSIFKSPK